MMIAAAVIAFIVSAVSSIKSPVRVSARITFCPAIAWPERSAKATIHSLLAITICRVLAQGGS